VCPHLLLPIKLPSPRRRPLARASAASPFSVCSVRMAAAPRQPWSSPCRVAELLTWVAHELRRRCSIKHLLVVVPVHFNCVRLHPSAMALPTAHASMPTVVEAPLPCIRAANRSRAADLLRETSVHARIPALLLVTLLISSGHARDWRTIGVTRAMPCSASRARIRGCSPRIPPHVGCARPSARRRRAPSLSFATASIRVFRRTVTTRWAAFLLGAKASSRQLLV